MKFTWHKFHYTTPHHRTIPVDLNPDCTTFWKCKKSLYSWIRHIYGIKKDAEIYIDGEVEHNNHILFVELYFCRRGKFNLFLGTKTKNGCHYESALSFKDNEFTVTKSQPSEFEKVIKRQSKVIQNELEKRLNGEWNHLTTEELKILGE